MLTAALISAAQLTPAVIPAVLFGGVLGGVIGAQLATVAGRMLRPPRRLPRRVYVVSILVTSLLLTLVMVRFGLSWELPAYLYLVVISVVLAIVDATERRLPNAIVHPSLLVMPALLTIAAAVTGAWPALLTALLGGLGLFLFYLVLALVSPGGIGMGDVKLAAVLGFALGYLGLTTLLVGAMAGFIIGGLVSLVALVARRVKLSGSLPFGPSMLTGTFLALLIS